MAATMWADAPWRRQHPCPIGLSQTHCACRSLVVWSYNSSVHDQWEDGEARPAVEAPVGGVRGDSDEAPAERERLYVCIPRGEGVYLEGVGIIATVQEETSEDPRVDGGVGRVLWGLIWRPTRRDARRAGPIMGAPRM